MKIPKLNQKLSPEQIDFLNTFSKSCRHSILSMVTNAQSGHPGGSLGCIDYLSLLYAFIVGQTGEDVIVSNGHISPAVYAVLAEMGYIPKAEVVKHFRKAGHIYEGHVTRQVRGVVYGTGPLGAGVSASSGFALAKKLAGTKKKVFALLGDGEAQEGQVYEMMNFADKYQLNNLVVFLDYNQVQLSDSLKKIMPINPVKSFAAAGWKVIEAKGHNYQDLWKALGQAHRSQNQPVVIVGHTIMGKGVDFMEATGKKHQADWHGKAPKPEAATAALKALKNTPAEAKLLSAFRKTIKWRPAQPRTPKSLSKTKIKIGSPRLYKKTELTDCRSAYGQALLDLAWANKEVVALTADLAGSVKTSYVQKKYPRRHIECGIAEQQMVSASGGLSLAGFVPFCSTFGVFMTSRAKDQARVNDINHTNVKMVSTHCGLSVGEDGPTHQAIDDMGSMLGLFNTMVIEPADPNHCDRIIRYVGSHYGNFYVRMGRHKVPVLTTASGKVLFDKNYKYTYGRCDILRPGKDLTVVASGPMVVEALTAVESLKKRKKSIELVIASSPKKFDTTLMRSIRKTKKVLVVEDHNSYSGFGSQLAHQLQKQKIQIKAFHNLGVESYQLSGTPPQLYKAAGIGSKDIEKKCLGLLSS